MAFVYCLLF